MHPEPAVRLTFWLWLALFSLGQAWLVALSLMPGGRAAPLFALLYALCVLLVWPLARSFRVKGRAGLILAVGLGLAFRALWLPAPVDADVFRYVWEGLVQLAGENPYLLAPDAAGLTPLALAHPEVWSGVFWREIPAIYPPLLELVFRGAAALSPEPWAMKAVLFVFDAACLALLALLVHGRGLRPGRLLYWALNPLALLFLAGDAHAESVQVFFLLLGLLCFERGRERSGFLALGAAVMSKYLALPVLLMCLTRKNLRHAWWAALPLAAFLPFLDAGGGIFATLVSFGGGHHYNGLLAEALWPLLGRGTPLALVAILALMLAAIFLSVHDRMRSAWLSLGCVVLCLPTVHPWYLAPVAVLLPLFPSRAWLWLCAGMAVTLPVNWITATGGLLTNWHWLTVAAYAPFVLLILHGVFRDGRIERSRRFSPPGTLSVIIPTLNEAERLPECLRAVRAAGCVDEIVVADGGSTDKTPEVAASFGAVVVSGPRGRGTQIAAGIRAAKGDVLVVLHADCLPEPGVFARIKKALVENPAAPGGAVGMRYGNSSPPTRLIAGLNNLRVIAAGIAFGDQMQFARREALNHAGGFPELPLMEDVELSLRLKEMGPCLFLPRGVTASGRRWRREGFFANVGHVVGLLARYLAERRLGVIRPDDAYYEQYYGPAAAMEKRLGDP